MKEKRLIINFFVIAIVFVLAGGIRLGFAQEPLAPSGEEVFTSTAGYILSPTMSYQGKLIQGGSPFDGNADMTFYLYDAEVGGILQWSEGPKKVLVENGLFHVVLGDTTALPVNDFDMELWLVIDVDGTTLPSQKLMGAPYAFSLAPGADISGNLGGTDGLLDVSNWGSADAIQAYSNSGTGVVGTSPSDHGVLAQGGGAGLSGAALYAKNTNDDGIALWAHNDSPNSSDAALVVSNDEFEGGEGHLIKGFGGDGGEDEFRIGNDGSFETKADTFIYIPGSMLADDYNPDIHWEVDTNGAVRFWPEESAVTWANFPIPIPGVLFGQPVKVKQITIFYKCENSTEQYIAYTGLHLQTDVDNFDVIAEDSTEYNSTTPDFYTIDVNYTLTSVRGILNLYIQLDPPPFDPDRIYWTKIGGIRVRLGHHDLY